MNHRYSHRFRRTSPTAGPGSSRPGVLTALLRAVGALAVLLLLLQAGAPPARAQVTNRIVDLASFAQSDLRALAMGNAFGAVSRGETALLYNPAGLVQFDFDLKLEFSLAFDGEEGDFFSDTVDLTTSDPTPVDVQAYLDKYLGTTQLFRFHTFSNFVANLAKINIGFGVGKYKRTQYSFEFQDTNSNTVFDLTDSLIQGNAELDMTMASFAFALFDGQLLIGATGKSFSYKEETASASFGTVITNSDVELITTGDEYQAESFDVGFIWRLEFLAFLRGQWSLTAYNVGGIDLMPVQVGGEQLEVPATYNFGIAIQPELPFAPLHIIISAEVEDLTGAIKVCDPCTIGARVDHDRTNKQRFHFGAELGLFETETGNNVFNARIGAHRGFLSFGYELNLFSFFRIVYTKYRDNLGHESRQDLHDFEAWQFSLGWGF